MAAKKPPNFSWVVRNVLAGCALPSQPAHLYYMVNEGVKHLVSLTEWRPVIHSTASLNHIHMPVGEFEAPSVKQASDFVRFVEQAREKEEPVTVHCHWGLGRTGTMIACFLVKAYDMSAQDAVALVRQSRPYSIETYDQENMVYVYAEHIQLQGKEET